jgi:hypothetical protein
MENIEKLSKEIKVMLDNTNITIDKQNSLLFSEFIYDFCAWHVSAGQKLKFENKGELKKAIKNHCNNV